MHTSAASEQTDKKRWGTAADDPGTRLGARGADRKDQKTDAEYIVSLLSAGADYCDKLGRVKELLDSESARSGAG